MTDSPLDREELEQRVSVEQCDREAAADFVRAWDEMYGDGQNDFGPSEVDSIWLRSGDHDGELIIQHFARHRLALSERNDERGIAAAKLEERAKVLRTPAGRVKAGWHEHDADMVAGELDRMSTAIRSNS